MVRKNVAEILSEHVTFELEGIDRMYLNAYVPSLQTGGGLIHFLKTQLEVTVPSTVMVAPMSRAFVAAVERFVEREGLDLKQYHKDHQALRTETTINDSLTSPSVVGSTICPPCGRSASPPTDASCASNR